MLAEFECPSCGQDFEKIIKLKDLEDSDGFIRCIRCGEMVERKFPTHTQVIFKGGGWHIADYD